MAVVWYYRFPHETWLAKVNLGYPPLPLLCVIRFYLLLCSEGEEWHRQRVPMSKFAMVPRKVAEFHEDFNSITLDLLKRIRQQRNPGTNIVSDVAELLFKWSFECKLDHMKLIWRCIDLLSVRLEKVSTVVCTLNYVLYYLYFKDFLILFLLLINKVL